MRRPAEDYPFYDIPGPIAIAHRGGNAAGIEKQNTLAAIQSASDAGITYVEIDVVDTADMEGLIYHDAKNKRDAKKLGLELTRVIQTRLLDDTRRYIQPGGEQIPTIDEVLSSFPSMRFFVDVKTKGAAIPVARAITSQRAQDRVSIGSYHYKYTNAVAELLGGRENVATGLGTFEFYLLRKLGWGLTRFLERSQATSLQPSDYEISDVMVTRVQELGAWVVVYAGPDKQQDNRQYIERNLDRGVKAVMSHDTKMMKEVFLSHDPQNASINS